MKLCELIDERLMDKDMSKPELARRTYVSTVAAYKWTQGKTIPSPVSTVIICDELDITPEEWFAALRETVA